MNKLISITVKHPDERRSENEAKFEVDPGITLEDLRKKCQEFCGIRGIFNITVIFPENGDIKP